MTMAHIASTGDLRPRARRCASFSALLCLALASFGCAGGLSRKAADTSNNSSLAARPLEGRASPVVPARRIAQARPAGTPPKNLAADSGKLADATKSLRKYDVTPVAHVAKADEPEDLPSGMKDETKPPELLPTPRPARGGLSLDRAINECLLADPQIRMGLEAINQAEGDSLTASLKPNPSLFTDAQLLPTTHPFTKTRQGGPPQQDFNVSYPIDWFLFGKRAAAMASASLGVRISESQFENLVRQRVTETALAFYTVVEFQALVDLARQDVHNYEQVESGVKKAVELEGRTQVELNRIRIDLLRSRQFLRDAQFGLAGSKARLRALLGRADSQEDFTVSGSLDAPLAARPLPVEQAYEMALENRPDLQALRWQVSQARANMTLERRKAFPLVAPTFGYTRQYQQKSIGFPDADSWSAALSMSLPLFDRNQGNQAKAAAAAAQSQYGLVAGEIELRAEIDSVVAELSTARANAEAIAKEQLQLAEQVRNSILKSFEDAEALTLLDVLDSQRTYRETYRLYITSRAGYWRALYKFKSAIGAELVNDDESAPPRR